jgi:hypothetical protein
MQCQDPIGARRIGWRRLAMTCMRSWALRLHDIPQEQQLAIAPAREHVRSLAFLSHVVVVLIVYSTHKMSGVPPSPFFFSQPLRYLKWASYNKPAYFYSIVVGCAGPIMLVTVPPIRRYLGEEQRPKIPMTYPGTCETCGGGWRG